MQVSIGGIEEIYDILGFLLTPASLVRMTLGMIMINTWNSQEEASSSYISVTFRIKLDVIFVSSNLLELDLTLPEPEVPNWTRTSSESIKISGK
jgi:hypothetical protein